MDTNVYVQKKWEEENITFYIHFQNNEAVRQIEVSSKGKIFLTLDNPVQEESMLLDQSIEYLDLEKEDFITEQDFNIIWKEKI